MQLSSKYLSMQLDFAFLLAWKRKRERIFREQSEKVHFSLDLVPSRTQHGSTVIHWETWNFFGKTLVTFLNARLTVSRHSAATPD